MQSLLAFATWYRTIATSLTNSHAVVYQSAMCDTTRERVPRTDSGTKPPEMKLAALPYNPTQDRYYRWAQPTLTTMSSAGMRQPQCKSNILPHSTLPVCVFAASQWPVAAKVISTIVSRIEQHRVVPHAFALQRIDQPTHPPDKQWEPQVSCEFMPPPRVKNTMIRHARLVRRQKHFTGVVPEQQNHC